MLWTLLFGFLSALLIAVVLIVELAYLTDDIDDTQL